MWNKDKLMLYEMILFLGFISVWWIDSIGYATGVTQLIVGKQWKQTKQVTSRLQ